MPVFWRASMRRTIFARLRFAPGGAWRAPNGRRRCRPHRSRRFSSAAGSHPACLPGVEMTMANATARALTYAAAQTARVAFYGAHYLAARLIARDIFTNMKKPEHRLPSLAATLAAMRDLFVQDWKNVEAGLYPMPVNPVSELRRAALSARFLADAPRVVARQLRDAHDEVR